MYESLHHDIYNSSQQSRAPPPLQIFLSGSTTKSKISVTGQLGLFRLPLPRGKKLPPNCTATIVHQPCRTVSTVVFSVLNILCAYRTLNENNSRLKNNKQTSGVSLYRNHTSPPTSLKIYGTPQNRRESLMSSSLLVANHIGLWQDLCAPYPDVQVM